MNKLFLVLLVVLVSIPSFFVSVEGLSDFERSLEPMKLSDVMVKLGKGETLTPGELGFLQQQMDLVQNTTAVTSGWIGADKRLNTKSAYIGSMDFSNSPAEGIRLRLVTPVAIPNATETLVTFTDAGSTVSSSPSAFFSWNGTDSIKITHRTAYDIYVILGTAQFEGNTDGRRAIIAKYYMGGVYQAGSTMASVSGTSLATTVPFVSAVSNPVSTGFFDEIKIYVDQSSGGELDLQIMVVSIFVVR